MIKWRKGTIDTNEGFIPCWVGQADVGTYMVFQNISHGKSGPTSNQPGGWWFEVRYCHQGREVTVGESPTVTGAKVLALEDMEEKREASQ